MATTKIIPGVLDLNEATSESGLKIPSSTELNRPATDVAGMIRNNTNESSGGTASCEEYYNGTDWKILNSNCPADTLDIFGDGSCIAAYTFNNNVNDLSGNYSATPTNVTFTTGLFSEAGSFNGSTSKAVTGGNMSSTFLSAFSISIWINPSQVSSTAFFFGNCNTARDRGIGFLTTNNAAVEFAAYETGAPGPYFRATSPSSGLTTGNWFNLVGTWDGTAGTNSVKIYINNSLSAQDTPRSSSIESTITPHIGNSGQANDLPYSGLIDQLRIFNKELSVSEINTLYNETRC